MKLILFILLLPFALIGQETRAVELFSQKVPTISTNEFSWFTYQSVRVVLYDATVLDCECEIEKNVVIFPDKAFIVPTERIVSLLCTRKKSENIFEKFEQDLNEIKLIIHK